MDVGISVQVDISGNNNLRVNWNRLPKRTSNISPESLSELVAITLNRCCACTLWATQLTLTQTFPTCTHCSILKCLAADSRSPNPLGEKGLREHLRMSEVKAGGRSGLKSPLVQIPV